MKISIFFSERVFFLYHYNRYDTIQILIWKRGKRLTKQLSYLKEYITEHDIDALYLDHPQTVSYLSNFESNPHERIVALFILKEGSFLLVPELEKESAQQSSIVQEIISYKDHEDPWKVVAKEMNKRLSSLKKIGIEENTLTVDRYKALKQLDHLSPIQCTDIRSILQGMRLIKTSDEIDRLKEAGEIADRALEIGIRTLKEGITEQEVVAEIEYEMKKIGITEMSFPTMVLFGDHAGSPHGTPGERQLKKGELVLFDLGVVKNGYTSDMTRTLAFGKVSDEIQDIYHVVLQAQQKAQAAVKPGITAEKLDAIARDCITKAGYGDYFTHRLGHGLGTSVHEFPSLAAGNDLVLQEGMCFSIEPGIYIPGKVGVRIEDCVHVTKDDCEPFTHTPKEFTLID